MTIRYNCKFFRGGIPCGYHKDEAAVCENCRYYIPKKNRILVIKLSAIGDVLRTTFILHSLKRRFKDIHIVWLTHCDAKPLLMHNELIDEIIENNTSTLGRLLVEKFNMVFNPSNDIESSILAAIVKANKKFGFIYSQNGHLKPLGKMARYYLEIGTNDNLKKLNTLTYQQMVSGMLNLEDYNFKPILRLTDEELAFAGDFKARNKLGNQLIVGLNTGAGKRWQFKKWPLSKTVELAKRINRELNAQVILFGGPEETDRNKEIIKECQDAVIDAGCNNSLREFASLINLVDIFVCTDTLGLHIAVALDKYVIGLFGPTSHFEVELYGKGIKIFAKEMDCLCCYKNTCSIRPNCMDNIGVDEVFNAIKNFKKS